MPKSPAAELVVVCAESLHSTWEAICEAEEEAESDENIPQDLIAAITRSLKSKTKSHRYVLPTQLLSKACNADLDCRSLQASYAGAGAFDARTIAHKVVVPFDRENHNVLGGSPEPYVNNPLRVPGVTADYAGQQKDKTGWGDLRRVLDDVEQKARPEYREAVLRQVLRAIYRRLRLVCINYPAPMRISL